MVKMLNWFMLPGMGATSHMYNALRHKLQFTANFVNWPVYRGEKTYAEVAYRVIDENRMKDGDVVGGSSLGGMVALEVAQILNPAGVVLLGSAVHKREVQHVLSLVSPFASVTPISLVQTLAGKRKDLVSTMFADSSADFIRAMCAYLNLWPGYAGSKESVFRLHGKKDHIIPCPENGCDIIEDAGHVLAITHVAETAAFMEKVRLQLVSNS